MSETGESTNPLWAPKLPVRSIREIEDGTEDGAGEACVVMGESLKKLLFSECSQSSPKKIQHVECIRETQVSPGAPPYLCDVVFSFDTTGSMRSVLKSVRDNLIDTVDRLFAEIEGIRIGIIIHGDYCDQPKVMWKLDLTKDIDAIKKLIANPTTNTGGGDAPECYELVLNVANQMNWLSEVKVLVVIGDQKPHEKGYDLELPKNVELKGVKLTRQGTLGIDWKEETDKCKQRGIVIFACHALAHKNPGSVLFYHHISKHTGGFYFPLNELQSFNYYMVTICMRAADGAEDLALLRERQAELEKLVQSGGISKEEALRETSEIKSRLSTSSIFDAGLAETTDQLRKSLGRTSKRVDKYVSELTTSTLNVMSPSMKLFASTLSHRKTDPVYTKENKEEEW
jgi:hypothetical protein